MMGVASCVSPLRRAIETDDVTTARKLLASGVSPNETDSRGFTPLHIAAIFGRTDVALLLLEHGADPRLTNRSSKTPSAVARERGFSRLAEILSEAEASVAAGRPFSPAPPPTAGARGAVHGSALVMELKRTGDVPAQLASVVTRLVLTRLDDAGLRTVSPEDIQLLLSVEKQKDALGCDDVRCIAELGGALGTDYVIYGQVALAGSQYNLTLTAIDARRSVAVARVSTMAAANEDGLIQSVPAAVSTLLSKMLRPTDERP